MRREEKEQWLYETYEFTSNFDFRRLEKYEEANNDICIDDLILDYTMLYKLYKDVYSIIKEVREYIGSNFDKSGVYISGSDLPYSYIEELLKILDKVEDNNDIVKGGE